MSNTAIKVSNLSKRYRIGLKDEIHDTFGGAFFSWLKSPISNFQRVRKLSKFGSGDKQDIIWAVKDISFEVKHGEVLGIIGRNGAGKSTLLKILARITEPSSGTAEINGRIASLLEVGTGFHPELTGRENVYLNGSILGMTIAEITAKFDEIVDFSGIEKFIDTPVKRYSSGMTVRLAFSVAAHLEPEILLVDEVLAVGDVRFQRKCLSKMGEVSREGRTVLFVSHNMTAMQSLCPRVIMLDGGLLTTDGTASNVIAQYLRGGQPAEQQSEWKDLKTAPGNDAVRIRRIRVVTDKGESLLSMKSALHFETEYRIIKKGIIIHLAYHLINELGVTVLTTGNPSKVREPGIYSSVFNLPANLLNSGGYFLKLLIVQDENRVTYEKETVASFTIHDTTERKGAWMGREPGVVQPILPWNTETLSEESGGDVKNAINPEA